MPLNEPIAFGVVRTAASQLVPILYCKILVFMCHKLFSIVRNDLFHITIFRNKRFKGRNHILTRYWWQQSEYWKLWLIITDIEIPFPFTEKQAHSYLLPNYEWDYIGMAGSFCCYLATVWHGIQFSTLFLISWFILGQYRLCLSLSHILDIPGLPLCNDPIHDFLKLGRFSNLPSYAAVHNVEVSSQGPVLIQGWVHLFEMTGWPSKHLLDICTGVLHGINSCTVKSRPF